MSGGGGVGLQGCSQLIASDHTIYWMSPALSPREGGYVHSTSPAAKHGCQNCAPKLEHKVSPSLSLSKDQQLSVSDGSVCTLFSDVSTESSLPY